MKEDQELFYEKIKQRWNDGLTFTSFNLQTEEIEEINLYLSRITHLILVCENRTGKTFLNLEKLSLEKFDYDHQLEYNLPHQQYILLQEPFEQPVILLFPTVKLRNVIFNEFEELMELLETIPKTVQSAAVKLFLKADKSETKTLFMHEIRSITNIIKAEFDDELEDILQYVVQGKTNKAELTLEEFVLYMQLLNCRKGIIHLYEKYGNCSIHTYDDYRKNYMTKQEFKGFLLHQQHEPVKEADKICELVCGNGDISFIHFSSYIVGASNEAQHPSYASEPIKTNLPLTSYYCYSSHNTYLTGNQLTSDSKAERYLQDLENGLRCVEIDVHDGDNGPIVKHGFTVTASVDFEDVIKIIAEFCFENEAHSPIILSIENHCEPANQYVMAEIMEDHLGKRILRIEPYIHYKYFPTLEETMGKVIVKCNGNYCTYADAIKKNNPISDHTFTSEEKKLLGQELTFHQVEHVPPKFIQRKNLFYHHTLSLQTQKEAFLSIQPHLRMAIKEQRESVTVTTKKKKINMKMLLVTSMLSGGKLGEPCPWESISISEGKMEKYFKKDKEKVRNHTDYGWIRSYPDGTRFDSSNYNPFLALEMGVQIIALNTQNLDYYTLCMKKLFMHNMHRVSGYRVKSFHEQNQVRQISILPVSCFRIRHETSSQIPVIQIKMWILGQSTDMNLNPKQGKPKNYTQKVEGNAFNPIFQNPKRLTVHYQKPETTFIIFQIEDCGVNAIPISHIKRGYRGVKLYNSKHEFNGSKILCWID